MLKYTLKEQIAKLEQRRLPEETAAVLFDLITICKKQQQELDVLKSWLSTSTGIDIHDLPSYIERDLEELED